MKTACNKRTKELLDIQTTYTAVKDEYYRFFENELKKGRTKMRKNYGNSLYKKDYAIIDESGNAPVIVDVVSAKTGKEAITHYMSKKKHSSKTYSLNKAAKGAWECAYGKSIFIAKEV